MKSIDFDEPTYRRFKRAYQIAQKAHRTEFEFDGQTFLLEFAKYVLEYLETEFTAPK